MTGMNGRVPEDWPSIPLGALCSFANGVNADKGAYGMGVPFINVLEVITCSHLRATDIPGRVLISRTARDTFAVRRGDVLFNRTSETQEEVGLSAVYDDDEQVVFGGFVIRGRFTSDAFDRTYAGYAFRAPIVRSQIVALGQGAIRANIGQASLKRVLVPVPCRREQRAIAEALSDVDGLLGALDALIAKKRAIKQAAMQQLLTGKTRLPGFSGEWEATTIGDVARPSGSRNNASGDLPVLACSKHLGFVDSLGYFKNRVFSKELDGYRLIRRGEIGYPANHVEEGSIGLQDLYDVALVSPIYVVFAPTGRMNSYFLHRLLKLDSYRALFATATNSSVNRRGSLRWPQFSQITVRIPRNLDEQNAIAAVLSDIESEIAALEARRDKTRAVKQGMMQQLLTGRVRLVKPEAAA